MSDPVTNASGAWFTCSDCRTTFTGPKFHAWENVRKHTLREHGREPHCNPAGQYASDEAKLQAEMGAFPKRFLILAA